MSSIAVFLVLGGATALAAGLAKNSVGSKQLKKNAVTTKKIKNGAVTTAKLKNGAVTGAKVNVSGFPKVPSASNADHASTADSANSANSVAGSTVQKFFYSSNATNARTTILSLGGLTLQASCEGATPQLFASTSISNVVIHAGGTYLIATPFYVEEDSLDPGEEINLLEEESDSVEGTFTYATPAGGVVTGTFLSEEDGFAGFETDCIIAGHAIG
jgi:hypothetical protein